MPFEATVNMGSVRPLEPKGRFPQYARNKLVERQQKFDDLERQGIYRQPNDIAMVWLRHFLAIESVLREKRHGYAWL